MRLSPYSVLAGANIVLLLTGILVLPGGAQTGGLTGPGYSKLVPGIAGPQTNDAGTATGKSAPPSPALPPIMMNDLDTPRRGKRGAGVPAKPDPLSKARQTRLMPLALQESQEEINKKLDALQESERAEMSDLWEATLAGSSDIQFVIERLMPTSNHAHATTILSRMLSTAVVGAMSTLNMVAPGPGTTAITQSGGNLIGSLLSSQDRKNLRKAQISEAEMIMLYKMVRDTADKLVEDFRTYKRTVVLYQRALVDLSNFEGMAADVSMHRGAAEQMEVDYIIRRQQNDILGIRFDLRKYRQQIVDLAGSNAVEKLDGQIREEFDRTQFAMPSGATPWDDWNEKVLPGS